MQFRIQKEAPKFFRLRKTDNLYAESYSRTVGLNLPEKNRFLISPKISLDNYSFLLHLSDFNNQNLIIKLKDVTGKIVYKKCFGVLSDEISLNCSVSDLPQGSYAIEIISDKNVFHDWIYVM